MPKIKYSAGVATYEARPKDDVCFVFQNRTNKSRILIGIVFDIGLLNDYDVTGGSIDPRAQSGALTLVGLMIENMVDHRSNLRLQQLACAVRRAVIYNYYLFIWVRRGLDRLDSAADRTALIEAWNDHGELHCRRDSESSLTMIAMRLFSRIRKNR